MKCTSKSFPQSISSSTNVFQSPCGFNPLSKAKVAGARWCGLLHTRFVYMGFVCKLCLFDVLEVMRRKRICIKISRYNSHSLKTVSCWKPIELNEYEGTPSKSLVWDLHYCYRVTMEDFDAQGPRYCAISCPLHHSPDCFLVSVKMYPMMFEEPIGAQRWRRRTMVHEWTAALNGCLQRLWNIRTPGRLHHLDSRCSSRGLRGSQW